jgi:hypothetical protein
VQRRQLVLVADAHEHVAAAERRAQDVEQRHAALEDAMSSLISVRSWKRCSESSRAAPST